MKREKRPLERSFAVPHGKATVQGEKKICTDVMVFQ